MMSHLRNISLQYDVLRHFNLSCFIWVEFGIKCFTTWKTTNLQNVPINFVKAKYYCETYQIILHQIHIKYQKVFQVPNFGEQGYRKIFDILLKSPTRTFLKKGIEVGCNTLRLSISQMVSGHVACGTNLQFYLFFMPFFHLEYYTICMLLCFDVVSKAVLIPMCNTRLLYIGHKWVLKRMAHANMRPQAQIIVFLPPKFYLLNTDE